MKAIDRQFAKIINGTTQFIIPVFQRDYSWSEEQCEQLWKDVVEIGKEDTDRGHFLGSIVYVPTGDSFAGFTRWLVIDGQQRLTTLTLLLTALRDHILDTNWTGSQNGPTVRRVENYFLKNAEEEGSRRHKLVLRRHDQESLSALIDHSEPPQKSSDRILENYGLFRDWLRQADPEHVYRGIGRLVVVDVTLDRAADDPQLVFESLNSTGVDLSQSDLIRNFILMRLPDSAQTRLYNDYWSKIETLFRGSERVFDAFMRDYIALRTQSSKQERADQIYFAFRRQFSLVGQDAVALEHLLQELLRFARYYAAFSIGIGGPDAAREPLRRLRRLVDVPAMLVMRLLDCHDHGTVSASQLVEAIEQIESYVFRRAICGEQTRGYWQVFANLTYKIDSSHPLDSLQVGLARQGDSYRFPDDVEFRKALEERDMYAKRVCFDLLEGLENRNSNEPSDTSRYSIEHIMPQNENLRPEWRVMLGEQWHEIQKEWLHRLGNLTLTGYNSTYSDRPFPEKKTIPGGFAESSVRLNRFVREQANWTSNEMEERGKVLAHAALSVWKPLVVDPALIEAANRADLVELAKRRDVAKVPMTSAARQLFEGLRATIKELDPDILELAEERTVSYYRTTFFMEVLPRKHHITLLLDVEFNEIRDTSGIAKDASQYKFFVNAQHQGDVYLEITEAADVDLALPVIRQALERARG